VVTLWPADAHPQLHHRVFNSYYVPRDRQSKYTT
jgi:hypothetical protein